MASTTTKTQTQKVAVPVDLLAKIKPIAAANRRSMAAEVAVAWSSTSATPNRR